jgi:arylsulfatase
MYGNFHRAEIIEGRPLALYNLDNDIKESNNLAGQHPDIIKELLKEAEKARHDLGDFGIKGNGVRPAAIIDNPVAQLMK